MKVSLKEAINLLEYNDFNEDIYCKGYFTLADINYICGVYDDKNVNRILGDEYNDFEIATA